MNILIPMAGRGSRFVDAGYIKPKPFIDVAGEPMIVRVMENLNVGGSRFILVALQNHYENEREMFNQLRDQFDVQLVLLDGVTEGTACSVLGAKKLIDNEDPLLIANSDQIIDVKVVEFLQDAQSRRLDGSIMCFRDEEMNPKWSFAKTDNAGFVTQVMEKEAISDLATVGVYFFLKGSYFVHSAKNMIDNDDRSNGEFYTCPVYNYLIGDGKRIGVFLIQKEQMHGIGTPNDLINYLASR